MCRGYAGDMQGVWAGGKGYTGGMSRVCRGVCRVCAGRLQGTYGYPPGVPPGVPPTGARGTHVMPGFQLHSWLLRGPHVHLGLGHCSGGWMGGSPLSLVFPVPLYSCTPVPLYPCTPCTPCTRVPPVPMYPCTPVLLYPCTPAPRVPLCPCAPLPLYPYTPVPPVPLYPCTPVPLCPLCLLCLYHHAIVVLCRAIVVQASMQGRCAAGMPRCCDLLLCPVDVSE